MKTGEKFNPQEAASLGRALVALRKSSGLTLKELSAACGVTASNLSNYEKGHQMPRYDSLRRILAAMELPFAALHQAERLVEGRPYPKADRPAEKPSGWAQEAGKAVAHCCLAFMELQAGGWESSEPAA
jgi:transcriptional regulator with XRE-family HTH domain